MSFIARASACSPPSFMNNLRPFMPIHVASQTSLSAEADNSLIPIFLRLRTPSAARPNNSSFNIPKILHRRRRQFFGQSPQQLVNIQHSSFYIQKNSSSPQATTQHSKFKIQHSKTVILSHKCGIFKKIFHFFCTFHHNFIFLQRITQNLAELTTQKSLMTDDVMYFYLSILSFFLTNSISL